ncbi:hypothetical protein [uncultured Sphingomonas sp.]|uniref:hypothetical protein n=1 Tax=uncultured Sphingomonas sp. TaxID=158754 RepID=UPI0025EFBC15|nr:hypothetical protein [uncultured Sphingomonas sp.]
MAIIMPPAPLPLRGVKWRLPHADQVNRSGWTGTRKVVGLPGAQLWTATGTFVTLVGADRAKPWKGFFVALDGQANRFPLIAVEQRQTTVANPSVRPGAGNGGTLPLQGLPTSQTILGVGDAMTVPLPSGHARKVVLIAPLVSNSQGQAIAYFGPELGEVPNPGAIVEIGLPYALVSLTSEAPGWDVDVGQTYTFPLAVEEAK